MASGHQVSNEGCLRARLAPLLAGVTGFAVPSYGALPPTPGMSIAFIVMLLIVLSLEQVLSKARKIWSIPVAMQIGYVVWGVYFANANEAFRSETALEMAVICVFIIWIYLFPGIIPVALSSLYQLTSAVNVAVMLYGVSSFPVIKIFLLAHTLFRVSVIYLLIMAYFKYRAYQRVLVLKEHGLQRYACVVFAAVHSAR
ncbi:MAG: hypothetical protein P8Y36_12695 [Alphaproteobacteria bacterium]